MWPGVYCWALHVWGCVCMYVCLSGEQCPQTCLSYTHKGTKKKKNHLCTHSPTLCCMPWLSSTNQSIDKRRINSPLFNEDSLQQYTKLLNKNYTFACKTVHVSTPTYIIHSVKIEIQQQYNIKCIFTTFLSSGSIDWDYYVGKKCKQNEKFRT